MVPCLRVCLICVLCSWPHLLAWHMYQLQACHCLCYCLCHFYSILGSGLCHCHVHLPFSVYVFVCFENTCLHIFLISLLIPCNVTCLHRDNTSGCFRCFFIAFFYETGYLHVMLQYIHAVHIRVHPSEMFTSFHITHRIDAYDWLNMCKYLQVYTLWQMYMHMYANLFSPQLTFLTVTIGHWSLL